ELMRVVRRAQIETKKLDDIPELDDADYIKMDIQGAELDAIQGGRKTFAQAVVVETEVEFVPLYAEQPLFADVDTALRGLGFMFHRFKAICGRTAKPLLVNNDPNAAMSQMLWADAVYVKDMLAWHTLPPAKLLKMVLILHEVYRAYDLCHLALQAYDSLCHSALAPRYLQALVAGR
ncbi:MAG: FkbM family methyltransferase, partial [Planctomycetota bacterium]|nr:FkbM family methyltransferase [Planctomycetota bacterium]